MQRSRLKKSLIFALPAVLTTTIAPLTSISCGGGKYSYLNDIKFNLINPSITTNIEIVDEFKKNPSSLKKYIEISNPNKYDIEIKNVESVGNSSIKILIKTSQNGKNEYNAWTQPITGLKDPSKTWEQKDLELLSKILLDQVKNNPKDLIDWQHSDIKNKFPYDIKPEMIKLKTSITELIAKKSPKVDLVANLDSKDDVKGVLSLSLELKNKNSVSNKVKYKIANNISLSTNEGLLSLDDLASKLTIDDLDLPKNIKDKLPSKFEDDIVLKKDSDFKKKYPNVKLIRVSKPDDENDDLNGIKNISFKLKYDHKESSKVANLSINKFYSTKQFDALCDSLTIEDLKINVDSDLSPSEYNVGNIQLKKDSPLLSINANLIISQTEIVLTDDQNGDLDIKVILADKINKCSYSKNLKITGFYSILKHNKQVEDFANSLSIDSFVLKNIRHYRASNYSVEEIEFKEEYNQKFIELIKKVDFKYTLEPKVSDGQEEVFIRLFFTAKNKKFSVEKIIGPYGGFYKTGDAYSLDSSDLAIILRRIFAYSHYVLHEDKIDPILKDISLNKYFLFNHGKITKSEIEQRLNLALHDQEFMQALIMNNQAGIHQAKRATKLVSWISRLPKLRVKIISWSDSSDYEQFVKFIFQLANSTVGNPDFDYDNSSTKYQFNTRKSGLTRVSVVRTKE